MTPKRFRVISSGADAVTVGESKDRSSDDECDITQQKKECKYSDSKDGELLSEYTGISVAGGGSFLSVEMIEKEEMSEFVGGRAQEKEGHDQVDEEVDEEEYTMQCESTVAAGKSLFFEKYNTDSSVYTDSTMTCPDTEKQLICIASIILTQIEMSETAEAKRAATLRAGFPEFEVLLREIKSSQSGAGAKADLDSSIGEVTTVPTLHDILEFLQHIYKKYSPSVNILSLVYLNRVDSLHGLRFNAKNWQALWVTVVIVAQKMWDDTSIKTGEYAKLLPGCSKQDLVVREVAFLKLLRYRVSVKSSLYAKFYYELRELFFKIVEHPSTPWEFRPLSIAKAKRIDALDHILESRLKRANPKIYASEVLVEQKEHNLRSGVSELR